MKTHPQAKKAKHSSFEAKAKNQAHESSILQAYKNGAAQLAEDEKPVQRQENKTGLPDNLKSGVENLSGQSLDDVKVHYNSPQPASLQAHAYAQGTDIHVAPGQEKHLPHEAWHVVQQKQGRVQPTKQLKGTTNINDDKGLEKEADVMGAKAMQLKAAGSDTLSLKNQPAKNQVYQLQTTVEWTSLNFNYMNSEGNEATKEVGGTMKAHLDPGDPIEGADAQSSFQKDMYDALKSYWHPGAKHWVRGHLLNANLGGPNVAPNLFPITGYANGDHLNYVENHVKKWVIDGNEVDYTVEATQNDGKETVGEEEIPNAAGSLDCTAETADGEKKISRTIYSEPVIKDAKDGAATTAPGHTSHWEKNEGKTDTAGEEAIEELLEGWEEIQFQFTNELIKNGFDGQAAWNLYKINESQFQSIKEVLDAIKDALDAEEEDHDLNDSESPDTEKDKVGSRVTNAKLKKWLGKSLSNTEAENWLTQNVDTDIKNIYHVAGQPDDEEIENIN